MRYCLILAALILALFSGPEAWACGGGGSPGSYSFGGDEGLEGLLGPGGATGPPNGGPAISRRAFYGFAWGPKFNFYRTSPGDLGPLRAYDTYRPMLTYGYTPKVYLLASGQGSTETNQISLTIGEENVSFLATLEEALEFLKGLINPQTQQYPQVVVDGLLIEDELNAALAEYGLALAPGELDHSSYWVRVDSITGGLVTLTVSMEHAGRTTGQPPLVVEVTEDRFLAAWSSTGPDSQVPIKFGPGYMMIPDYQASGAAARLKSSQLEKFKELLPGAASAPGFIHRLVSALQAGVTIQWLRGGQSCSFGPDEAIYLANRMYWARRGTAMVLSDLGYSSLAPAYEQTAEQWSQLAAVESDQALISFFTQMAQLENQASAAVLARPDLAVNSVRGQVSSTTDPSGAFVALVRDMNPANPPLATTLARNSNGDFIFAQASPGTYYLIAYRDNNFNDVYDPGEPMGHYQGTVVLHSGGQVTGLEVRLP